MASDIAQDVFTKIWEKRTKLNGDKVKPLLFKIASDELNSYWRRNKVKSEYQNTLSLKLELNSPEAQAQYNELKEQYENVLSTLPEKQRVVFMMNRMEGLTYAEIAQRLSVSVKAIEKRMSQAIAQIRKTIKYP